MNTASVGVVRVNITLPKKVWGDLERELPSRGRSRFIASAIEDKLRHERRRKAFEDLASLPPTFTDIADGAVYVRETRQKEDEERSKELDI